MWYPNIILFQAPNPSLIEPSFHENLTWFQKSESEFRILEATTTTTNKHQQMERKITSRPFVIERNNLRKNTTTHTLKIMDGSVVCMCVGLAIEIPLAADAAAAAAILYVKMCE